MRQDEWWRSADPDLIRGGFGSLAMRSRIKSGTTAGVGSQGGVRPRPGVIRPDQPVAFIAAMADIVVSSICRAVRVQVASISRAIAAS